VVGQLVKHGRVVRPGLGVMCMHDSHSRGGVQGFRVLGFGFNQGQILGSRLAHMFSGGQGRSSNTAETGGSRAGAPELHRPVMLGHFPALP
jgi:hypothetical protein